MADQQDRPDETPDAIPRAPAPEPSGPVPEATPAAAQPPPPPPPPPPPAREEPPAKPAKAAKKAPAKAAKKAPVKAAKKAAPAKKAAKKAPPKPGPQAAPKLADTNGERKIADAVKEAAAQAKSTVAAARNPTTGPDTVQLIGPDHSRRPLAAAIAAGVLAILLVLVARRHGSDD